MACGISNCRYFWWGIQILNPFCGKPKFWKSLDQQFGPKVQKSQNFGKSNFYKLCGQCCLRLSESFYTRRCIADLQCNDYYIYIYIYIYIYMCVCVCAHTHTHTPHTHIYTSGGARLLYAFQDIYGQISPQSAPGFQKRYTRFFQSKPGFQKFMARSFLVTTFWRFFFVFLVFFAEFTFFSKPGNHWRSIPSRFLKNVETSKIGRVPHLILMKIQRRDRSDFK